MTDRWRRSEREEQESEEWNNAFYILDSVFFDVRVVPQSCAIHNTSKKNVCALNWCRSKNANRHYRYQCTHFDFGDDNYGKKLKSSLFFCLLFSVREE